MSKKWQTIENGNNWKNFKDGGSTTYAKRDDVKAILLESPEVLKYIKNNLVKMQQRLQTRPNKHRREVEFNEDDMVLLNLQQYWQHSVARPISVKLSHWFYGLFKVVKKL